MTVSKKGTLLIVSGPRHAPDRKHLHVICTDADADGNMLIVGVCSVRPDFHDPTCTLKSHEHSFLTHDSFVLYSEAEIIAQTSLEKGIAANKMVPKDEINGQSFLRVANGICRSPYTPRKIKKYAGCQVSEPQDAAAA